MFHQADIWKNSFKASYPKFNDPTYKKDKEDTEVMKGVINEKGKKVNLKPYSIQ